MQMESDAILKLISTNDKLYVLDENGKSYSSPQLASLIETGLNDGSGDLVFVIGGAYGVHKDVKSRSNKLVSLSAMTFTHQMIKLFFTEQLYRAFTILKNEPYHHS